MTSFESVMEPHRIELPEASGAQNVWIEILRIIGLASTIYLVGHASLLIFLAVVFGSSAPGITTLEYGKYIAMNATPALCYAAIGVTGLRFLPSRRFRMLGLSAILFQIALAIFAFANPESLPMFTDWLL